MNTKLLDQAVARVRTAFPGIKPRYGLILGSGLAEIAGNFTIRAKISGNEVWGSTMPEVSGHSRSVLRGEHAGLETLIFCGRHHWYEGLGWEPIALPIYLLKQLGASFVVLTNAAGGIRADLAAGDVMIIDDHINAMGVNPLTGNADRTWGPQFSDQSNVYDPQLRQLMDRAAARSGTRFSHGVYLATTGPTYETPAEVRAFRTMGADAVGMSTVPEAILANAAGLRVAGLSTIANMAAGLNPESLSHDAVINAVQRSIPALKPLIAAFWNEMDELITA
ncbi:MAG: purine-nucleoside phosphorylase [bacterium]